MSQTLAPSAARYTIANGNVHMRHKSRFGKAHLLLALRQWKKDKAAYLSLTREKSEVAMVVKEILDVRGRLNEINEELERHSELMDTTTARMTRIENMLESIAMHLKVPLAPAKRLAPLNHAAASPPPGTGGFAGGDGDEVKAMPSFKGPVLGSTGSQRFVRRTGGGNVVAGSGSGSGAGAGSMDAPSKSAPRGQIHWQWDGNGGGGGIVGSDSSLMGDGGDDGSGALARSGEAKLTPIGSTDLTGAGPRSDGTDGSNTTTSTALHRGGSGRGGAGAGAGVGTGAGVGAGATVVVPDRQADDDLTSPPTTGDELQDLLADALGPTAAGLTTAASLASAGSRRRVGSNQVVPLR